MSNVDGLTVMASFSLADDILDEELDLIEANLGELLKQAVYLGEADE